MLDFEEIKGINDKRFSSSPNQAVNQEEEETAMAVPRVKEAKNKSRAGCKVRIKKRRDLHRRGMSP